MKYRLYSLKKIYGEEERTIYCIEKRRLFSWVYVNSYLNKENAFKEFNEIISRKKDNKIGKIEILAEGESHV